MLYVRAKQLLLTEPLGTCVSVRVCVCALYITVTYRDGERHRCCSRLTLIWRHCPQLSRSCRQIYMLSCVVQSHHIKPWLLNSGPKPVLVFPRPHHPLSLSLLSPSSNLSLSLCSNWFLRCCGVTVCLLCDPFLQISIVTLHLLYSSKCHCTEQTAQCEKKRSTIAEEHSMC